MKCLYPHLVILACAVGFPVSAQEEKPKGDLAALQGAWRVWLAPNDTILFEIKGNSFSLVREMGGQKAPPWKGTLKIDESTSPRQLTWLNVKIADRPLPENLCIYEVHADTFLLIGGGPVRRPEQFFSGSVEGGQTWVLKREKAK